MKTNPPWNENALENIYSSHINVLILTILSIRWKKLNLRNIRFFQTENCCRFRNLYQPQQIQNLKGRKIVIFKFTVSLINPYFIIKKRENDSPRVFANEAMNVLTLLTLNSSMNSSITYFFPSSSMIPIFTSATELSNPKLKNKSWKRKWELYSFLDLWITTVEINIGNWLFSIYFLLFILWQK